MITKVIISKNCLKLIDTLEFYYYDGLVENALNELTIIIILLLLHPLYTLL